MVTKERTLYDSKFICIIDKLHPDKTNIHFHHSKICPQWKSIKSSESNGFMKDILTLSHHSTLKYSLSLCSYRPFQHSKIYNNNVLRDKQ